jgi:flagellar basal-body rod protein FlgC
MDYMTAFAISGSGMAVEKMRVDAVALNLANVHSTRSGDEALYGPLQVISRARPTSFQAELGRLDGGQLMGGAEVVELRRAPLPPRLVYEPGHPNADARGFVSYPGVNPVTEMVTMMTSLRAYQANVAALNAAKSMMQRALDIGGNT